ncbi:hypothetical protein [Streptomyces atroolivaceus]|uniref:hypothetical protein n=1 Tax=Streptomyces atroolivaceus TaxID=66869 RepID=UPI002025773B|nr:hypothetical protein [Streptomyces atroolivaceus]
MSPVGASSRTACESVPEKEWFCQAASEPPKSADATVCLAGARIARWIGGRPAQSRPRPGAPAPSPADGSGAGAGAVPPPPCSWPRPRL